MPFNATLHFNVPGLDSKVNIFILREFSKTHSPNGVKNPQKRCGTGYFYATQASRKFTVMSI
jgi:hypothetical protein